MRLLESTRRHHQNQRGFLVIALLALISIMLIYIAANLHVLASLKRDIRLLEQKQVQRLNRTFPSPTAANTNSPPATVP